MDTEFVELCDPVGHDNRHSRYEVAPTRYLVSLVFPLGLTVVFSERLAPQVPGLAVLILWFQGHSALPELPAPPEFSHQP